MKLWAILFLILTMPLIGKGQYFQYSQYNFTDQRINPALVASSEWASAGFIFRNQNTGGDAIRLKSNMVSGAYPLLSRRTGKRWAGIGLSLMDDRSGGIFTLQEISLSYAINVFFTRFQSLSLGFKGLYQQRSVNLNGLVTGSQYIDDRGFDQSLYNGENFGLLRSDFFTFSSGLFWQQEDRGGRQVAYWGLSIFDLNKPGDSFSGIESQLHSTWVASGGVRVYHQQNISFMPEFLLTHSASRHVLNVGLKTSYEVKPYPNQLAGRIDLITKYVPGRSGIVGLQLHRDQFAVGFSYDFPVVRKNAGNTGAFEVALQIRRLVKPGMKKKIAQRKKSPVQSKAVEKKPVLETGIEIKSSEGRPAVKNDSDVSDRRKPEHDLGASLRLKRDSVIANAQAGRVLHEPFVIEKLVLHFNFEFNSARLDQATMKYLDDLSTALQENEHMKIKLTGHTDNVGAPAFNERLSLFRANVVKQYLLNRGVDPARIATEGKGLTEPLNQNRTEAERALNRRVELLIFYQQ